MPLRQERKRVSPTSPTKNNGNEKNFEVGHSLAIFCGIEFARKISAASTEIQDESESGDRVNRMDDGRLAKITKNGEPNSSGPPGQSPKRLQTRKSNINIAGKQTHWIKHGTCKKKKKKKYI